MTFIISETRDHRSPQGEALQVRPVRLPGLKPNFIFQVIGHQR